MWSMGARIMIVCGVADHAGACRTHSLSPRQLPSWFQACFVAASWCQTVCTQMVATPLRPPPHTVAATTAAITAHPAVPPCHNSIQSNFLEVFSASGSSSKTGSKLLWLHCVARPANCHDHNHFAAARRHRRYGNHRYTLTRVCTVETAKARIVSPEQAPAMLVYFNNFCFGKKKMWAKVDKVDLNAYAVKLHGTVFLVIVSSGLL